MDMDDHNEEERTEREMEIVESESEKLEDEPRKVDEKEKENFIVNLLDEEFLDMNCNVKEDENINDKEERE